MRRFLWALLLAAAGFLSQVSPTHAWPEDDFTSQLVVPTARPRGLPTGVEPESPSRLPSAPVGPARIQPVPNPFPLPANVNPWLICASTYAGPDGMELAQQLTVILRNQHRLTAFIYNRGDEERQAQLREWQERQKRYPGVPIRWRGYRVTDQYAVLIDGFKDFASASGYLSKVKSLPMPVLKLASGMPAYDTMDLVEPDLETKRMITRRANMNPFQNAMVVRNPRSASGLNNRPKFDPFWKELNSGEKYCLFDNPKRYTLLVREYAGTSVVQQSVSGAGSFLSAIGLGDKGSDALDAAGAQAREIVRFLRTPQIGMESWILHMRKCSNVYVGGFDGPEDPELPRVMRRLAALKFNTKDGKDPIGLYPNPPLVEIPRE